MPRSRRAPSIAAATAAEGVVYVVALVAIATVVLIAGRPRRTA